MNRVELFAAYQNGAEIFEDIRSFTGPDGSTVYGRPDGGWFGSTPAIDYSRSLFNVLSNRYGENRAKVKWPNAQKNI